MTVRELRQMLAAVDDQRMTVKELRDLLFQVQKQDCELYPETLLMMTFKYEKNEEDEDSEEEGDTL